MKTLKNLFLFLSGTKSKKTNTKKDAEIKYNSTLFFQLGMIISVAITAYFINTTFKELNNSISDANKANETEEIIFHDFKIITPIVIEPEVEIEQPKKVILKDKIRIVDKENENLKKEDIITEPEEVKINKDTKIVVEKRIDTEPKTDNTIYGLTGVERVPVFPGCETFTTNEDRIQCLSIEMGKLINKRFNNNIAADAGLKGSQRIYVSFVINKTGMVSDVQVRAPHPRLEAEAKRVVKLIPKMLPGLQNNNAVDVRFNLPINFAIQEY